MTLRPFALALLLGLAALPLRAEVAPAPAETTAIDPALQVRIAAFAEVLQIGPVFDVMREEGLDYGRTLEDEMFPGAGGAGWMATVELVYDSALMRQRFDPVFQRALARDPAALGAMEAFFGSERGQRILALEIEARRALMDEAVEDAARIATEEMEASGDPRLDLVRQLAAAGDLVEMNVAGALNANLAFYRAMADAGAFPGEMTEDDMLAEVWGQEPEVRAETEDWLFPYLVLAYQPLPDEDLAAYIAFSESSEGRALNAALFAAFDVVFTSISADLGRAVAQRMQGDDI